MNLDFASVQRSFTVWLENKARRIHGEGCAPNRLMASPPASRRSYNREIAPLLDSSSERPGEIRVYLTGWVYYARSVAMSTQSARR